MKTFKQIDLWISIMLITVSTVVVVSARSVDYLLNSYCIIGGWQVISMVVHAWNKWFMKKRGRRSYYHWQTLAILGMAVLGLAIPVFLLIFYILLFVSPVLAVMYTLMCYDELKELRMNHSLNLK